jgi:hypothetical protein
VVGEELAIAQGEMANTEPRDEKGKRDLGRVGFAAEHAFREEGAAQRNAINPANQPILTPDLDRVSLGAGMKGEHRLFDRTVDPGLRPVGATQQDVQEVAVGGHGEAARAQAFGEASRTVKAVQRQMRPGARFDPEEIVAGPVVGHREHARSIAAQEQVRVEREAHAKDVTRKAGAG